MLRVEPEILRDYVAAGAVQLVFHHVLDHGAASVVAHKAAECAGSQAPLTFWQMHELLFERQDQLWQASEDTVTQMAGELALDTAAFRTCMADPASEAKVTRLDQERRERGVRLRPTFDINGRLIEGAIPYATFRTVLDETQP